MVAWWPNEAPANLSNDLLGSMARSRITDAMHSSNPMRIIADQVESMLEERFGVFDTDIHIEPAPIPEDEILDNVYKKLLMREQLIDQGNQLEELLAEDFLYIRQDGEQMVMAAGE